MYEPRQGLDWPWLSDRTGPCQWQASHRGFALAIECISYSYGLPSELERCGSSAYEKSRLEYDIPWILYRNRQFP